MAIFASTTTSGYSDPLKALSIKALEKRQADMLAQRAQQAMPEIANPLQGAGYVINQLADQMQQNRVEQAAAGRRQDLARVMAGIGPEGPTAQQLALIHAADPDLGAKFAQQAFEARQSKERYAHEDAAAAAAAKVAEASQSRQFGHQDTTAAKLAETQAAAAAEKARVDAATAAKKAETDEAAAVSAESRFQSRPQSDLAKLQADLKSGKIDQAQFDAAAKKLTAPSVGEQKIINEQKAQSVDAQSTLATLDEASRLLESPHGIHTGNWAGAKTEYGRYIPESLGGPDPERTKNTLRYNEIMGAQALQALTQMKGASSDKDVQINFKIVNDPNAPLANKRQAIQVLKDKLAAHLQIANEGIVEAGGTPVKIGGASPATPDPNAGAREWLAANPNDPRAEAVRKKLEGK